MEIQLYCLFHNNQWRQVSRRDAANCSNLPNNANIKVAGTFDPHDALENQSSNEDADADESKILRRGYFLRIFKLARHITGLQTLGMTLKNR